MKKTTKRYCDPNIFKERLKTIMSEKGYTQRQLAEVTGLGLSTVKQYTSGQRTPEKQNLSIIAAKLGVLEDWLIGAVEYRTMFEKFDAEMGAAGLQILQADVKSAQKEQAVFDFSDDIIGKYGFITSELTTDELQQLHDDILDYIEFKIMQIRKDGNRE